MLNVMLSAQPADDERLAVIDMVPVGVWCATTLTWLRERESLSGCCASKDALAILWIAVITLVAISFDSLSVTLVEGAFKTFNCLPSGRAEIAASL